MQKSPFKFLDSYTEEDRETFFGRDKEIEELYLRVFESRILLVYGTSGTGKSSLINCGLSSKFNDSDWLPVNVRRGGDINQSLFEELHKTAISKSIFEKVAREMPARFDLEKLLRSLYLDHFRPVYLIFDQFEELFIFGNGDEKAELVRNIERVLNSDIQCRFIFIIREEYLAGITEFEHLIPTFLSNRIRIEKMTRHNAIQTIEGPCRVSGIEIEPGFAELLLEKLSPDRPEVELTWLQVFLDKVIKLAEDEDHVVKKIGKDLIPRLGDVKDLLGTFLEEQISQLSDPEAGLVILKSFVSVKGTKHQKTEDEIIDYCQAFGKNIDSDTVRSLMQRFVGLRILRDKDENGRYELRHDSLASKIFEKITLVEKELLEIRTFIENAFLNFERRELLLKDEDIKYIAPYEDKLFLSERMQRFISLSKRELQRERHRRQNILVAVAAALILTLSFFTIWALHERSNALTQQQFAEEQMDAAVIARDDANLSKRQALESMKKAEQNERIAIEERNHSDEASRQAQSAKAQAVVEKDRAERLSEIATEQARIAGIEKKAAEDQRIIAEAAEAEAKRLSLLSTAQNLALRSLSMNKSPVLMGLAAAQAYVFNRDNAGASRDPVIYEALYMAWSALDSSRHQVLTGSPNETGTMADNGTALLTADYYGIVRAWNPDGSGKVLDNFRLKGPVDFIRFSPSGRYLLYGYENSDLFLKVISNDNTGTDKRLKGHRGVVRAASFNADESLIASGGSDSTVIVWKIGQNEIEKVLEYNVTSSVRSVTFGNADTLASVQEDHSIVIRSLSVVNNYKNLNQKSDKPLCIAFNPGDRKLYAAYASGTIAWFDFRKNGEILSQAIILNTSASDQMAFNDDGSFFAVACWDKSIKLYAFRTYQSHPVEGTIEIEGLPARSRMLFFDRSDKLISALGDRTIRIWETSPEKIYNSICALVKRNMTEEEWSRIVGKEITYARTFGNDPVNNCK